MSHLSHNDDLYFVYFNKIEEESTVLKNLCYALNVRITAMLCIAEDILYFISRIAGILEIGQNYRGHYNTPLHICCFNLISVSFKIKTDPRTEL